MPQSGVSDEDQISFPSNRNLRTFSFSVIDDYCPVNEIRSILFFGLETAFKMPFRNLIVTFSKMTTPSHLHLSTKGLIHCCTPLFWHELENVFEVVIRMLVNAFLKISRAHVTKVVNHVVQSMKLWSSHLGWQMLWKGIVNMSFEFFNSTFQLSKLRLSSSTGIKCLLKNLSISTFIVNILVATESVEDLMQ